MSKKLVILLTIWIIALVSLTLFVAISTENMQNKVYLPVVYQESSSSVVYLPFVSR